MSTIFPWQVTDSGVRDDAGYICLIPKPTHYPGQDQRYKNEVAERQARAILISAAPDLLAELEKQIEHSYNPFEPDNQSDGYKRMKALYAKATGAQS